MKNNNVIFLEKPRNEKYGTVVKWKDIYGNKWARTDWTDFLHSIKVKK